VWIDGHSIIDEGVLISGRMMAGEGMDLMGYGACEIVCMLRTLGCGGHCLVPPAF